MSKINKIGKSSFVVAILSFLLVAVLAFGGTYAYFSDHAEASMTSPITTGYLQLDGSVTSVDNTIKVADGKYAVPNQQIIDAVTTPISVNVNSNINYRIMATVTATFTLVGHTSECTEEACPDCQVAPIQLVCNTTQNADWIVVGDGTAVVDPENKAVTTITYTLYEKAVSEATDKSADLSESIKFTAQMNKDMGKEESTHFMDSTFTITVNFRVAQADFVGGDGVANTHQAAFEDVDDATAFWSQIA